MKPELLVIAGQLYCGEYVLESCTRVAMRSEKLVGDSISKNNGEVQLGQNTVPKSQIPEPNREVCLEGGK